MDGLRAFLGTEMLVSSGGALSGETALDSTGGVVAASGSLRLDDARFNGVEVGYPVELDYALEARLAEGLYVFEEATLGLGSAPLSLTGQVDTGADPTRLDLRFRASDVPIEEAARLASAFGIAFPPEAAVAGRLDLDVTATGSADDPAFNGTVAGRQLVVSGTAVRQPVEVDRIDIALSPSRIEAPEFGIRSGQSNATARFALDDYRSEAPRIDARLQAPGATLPDIQSIARAYGVTSLDGIEGAGALDVDLRASGPLDSAADSTAMMRALNGAIHLDFSPLTLMGVNTASELGTIGGFDVGSAAGNLTELARLTGQIAIANGIASTDNLQAQLPIGNVAAAGTADLATQQLDLRLSAVLSQAFSQSVGGTGIAGYLRTALSNSAGELVLPVRVRGTFGAPEFSPDTEAIGAMQAERLLPSLQNPGSLLDSLLGGGQAAEPATDPETGEPQEAPPASEPEQVIRGILGGIFGGSDEEN
jgi:hypothetical protein